MLANTFLHHFQSPRRSMRRLVSSLCLVVGLIVSVPAIAEKAEWDRLNEESQALFEKGQYAQATALTTEALRVAEKEAGPDHPSVAISLNNLALIHQYLGKYTEAEPLNKRSLAILEKALGPDHPQVALGLNNLANLYRIQGKYAEAEPLYKRSLAISEKSHGPDHPDVASSSNNLALLYNSQGKYAEAELLYKRSLAISEKSNGPDHPNVAYSLKNLAGLYHNQGKYAEAELLYVRSLAIREKALGPNHPNVAESLNGLAIMYDSQGKYAEAEPLYKRSLAIMEKALGPDSPEVATTLSSLASQYKNQGKYAEAEPLYKRSLAIHENAFGPDHPAVAISLNGLADLYGNQRKYAESEALFKRALTIYQKSLDPKHPEIATTLGNLATLYKDQGKFEEGEPLFRRSLSIHEKSFGPNHPHVATSLNNLAILYVGQKKYAEAEPLFKRSLAISEKSLDPDHPTVANSLNNLAILHLQLQQHDRALAESRRATGIYRARISKALSSNDQGSEAANNRRGFAVHLFSLAANPTSEPPAAIADESFQVAQLMQATGTADAVAKMSARFAKGDGELAKLVRDRQDAEARRARAETNLTGAFGKTAQERNPALEQRLRDDIAAAGKAIEAIDTELARRFPEYHELARLQPVSVDEVRALLKPGEAMLAYALAGDTAYLWVVTKADAQFLPLKAKAADIKANLSKVRGQMEFSPEGNAPRVSVEILHELHQALIAPALPHLGGISHLLIVPDGALQSLPFGMLVASPPPAVAGDADYRKVDWLARHYAMSVLPSVGSIKALRQFAKSETAKEPFAGFGDPLVGEADGVSRGKRAKVDIATVFRGSKVRGGSGQPLPTLEIADVEAIRKTPRLPETADELRQIGKALKAGPDSIWLQQKATETAVKGMDLSKYQTLAFATHGMMAGEVGGVGEPGLILTPPKEGTLEDDGYLAASEIAKLRLNADWTILSACNTASADGTPGAEGLSGLAKAFFYAGSRSLLVSHWPVASDATVPLTTKMLAEYKANPAQGKAEAHRKSMLALMDSTDHPEFAHPIYWAPFVVVGEGGAGRR